MNYDNFGPSNEKSVQEYIQEAVKENLSNFISTKYSPESEQQIRATLINLFRQLAYAGVIHEDINPDLVRVQFDPETSTVHPANGYTQALMMGKVNPGTEWDKRPIKKYTRYDLAKGDSE